MKSLLSPLFFQSRFCKHCASIIRKKDPNASLGIFEFEAMPPLGTFSRATGFRPDFPAMLLFESFIIDGEAHDLLISDSAPRWAGSWPELLEALGAEGALEVADVPGAARVRSHERGAMLRNDMRTPEAYWRGLAYYNSLMAQAHSFLEKPDVAEELSWHFDPEIGGGVRGSDGHVHNIAVVLGEAKDSDDEAHRALYDQAVNTVAGHLREVNAAIAASAELEAIPLMWAPYQRYLEQKRPVGMSDSVRLGRRTSEFFRISFPAFAPLSVRDFLRLRRDRRLESLRNEISRAVVASDIGDPTYPQRVISELLKLRRGTERIRSIVGWISAGIGMIPVPGLGLGATAAAEGVNRLIGRRRERAFDWFYLISDGRGGS